MKRLILIALIALIPVSAHALDTQQLLATIGMPLAVAAVADIAGVPQDQLATLVSAFNQADVPVVEQVQIIRYVPVALVTTRTETTSFVQFVQQQISQGVTGSALVPVVTQELQTYYPSTSQIIVTAPAQTTFVEAPYVPQTVITQVAEVRSHPHGGPPGQIKKQLGLQTGAEVVHGTKPGKKFRPAPVIANTPMTSAARPEKVHGNGKGHNKQVVIEQRPMVVAPQGPGHGHGPDGNGPPGQQKPKGGKGHGKG